MSVHPEFRPRLLAAADAAPGVSLFRFESWPGFSFVPGQFLMFHFADDPKTWRAYSICSAPRDAGSFFEVAVGMVGAFSDRLGQLKPGGENDLVARGPFGKWVRDGEGHAVLISGGTGITPFRSMALLGKGKTTIFYSAKTENDLIFKDEYGAWKAAGADMFVRTTRTGREKRFTPAEIVAATRDANALYFICGPKSLVEDMKAGLAAAGVPDAAVRTEKWGDYTDLF